MLVFDRHLAPEVVHAQQVGDRVFFVRAEVVHGMADADVLEGGVAQAGLGPCRSVVETVLESEFFVGHCGSVCRLDALANRLLDFRQLKPVAFLQVKPVDDLQHPAEIRAVIGIVGHGQHRILSVAGVCQRPFDHHIVVERLIVSRGEHLAVERRTAAVHLLRQVVQQIVDPPHPLRLLGRSRQHAVEQHFALTDKPADPFQLFLGTGPAEIVGIHARNPQDAPFDALQPLPQPAAVIEV